MGVLSILEPALYLFFLKLMTNLDWWYAVRQFRFDDQGSIFPYLTAIFPINWSSLLVFTVSTLIANSPPLIARLDSRVPSCWSRGWNFRKWDFDARVILMSRRGLLLCDIARLAAGNARVPPGLLASNPARIALGNMLMLLTWWMVYGVWLMIIRMIYDIDHYSRTISVIFGSFCLVMKAAGKLFAYFFKRSPQRSFIFSLRSIRSSQFTFPLAWLSFACFYYNSRFYKNCRPYFLKSSSLNSTSTLVNCPDRGSNTILVFRDYSSTCCYFSKIRLMALWRSP